MQQFRKSFSDNASSTLPKTTKVPIVVLPDLLYPQVTGTRKHSLTPFLNSSN